MTTVTMSPVSKPTYRVGPRTGSKFETLIEVPDCHVTDDLLVDGDMECSGTIYCTTLSAGVTVATNHLVADLTVDSGVDITAVAGAEIFDYALSTGAFTTGTGTNTLSGDVAIASGKNLTMAGASTFTTGTGAVSLAGNTTISGTRTFTTGTGAVALNGSTTVATTKTLAVTDADAFTVGGIIVPQYRIITVPLDAATVDKWVFVADAAYMLDSAEYIFSVTSTSGTVDIKKSTSVQAPASGATMLTGTGSLAGTANTVNALTPHGTGGNKSLADGNTMSVCVTGTMTGLVGGILTIRMKRI